MKCTIHQRPFCPTAACQREVNSRDDDAIVQQIRTSIRQKKTAPKKAADIPPELRDLLPGLFVDNPAPASGK